MSGPGIRSPDPGHPSEASESARPSDDDAVSRNPEVFDRVHCNVNPTPRPTGGLGETRAGGGGSSLAAAVDRRRGRGGLVLITRRGPRPRPERPSASRAAESNEASERRAGPGRDGPPVQGRDPRTSTQIGSVQPFEEADLYAKVSGYLSDPERRLRRPREAGPAPRRDRRPRDRHGRGEGRRRRASRPRPPWRRRRPSSSRRRRTATPRPPRSSRRSPRSTATSP